MLFDSNLYNGQLIETTHKCWTSIKKMKAILLFFVGVATYATAQDTYFCPDGWELFVRNDNCPILSK